MSNLITVTGVDPALRNLGLARAHVDLDTLEVQVSLIQLVETERQVTKQVRKSSDDLRRARILQKALNLWCAGSTFAMAEIPTGTQSASGAMSNGICIGVLASCPVPIIELSPTEVKLASVGIKTATKSEMIEWAMAKHPKLPWLTRKLKGEVVPIADNEHLADAVAAIYAGIATEQFAQARSLLKAAA